MIYNMQTEQNLLGAILHLKGYGETVSDTIQSLSLDDFHDAGHKAIFGAMKDIYGRGMLPDLNEVSNHPSCTDSFVYLLELTKNTTSGLNLKAWTTQVKELTALRVVQGNINNINEIISSVGNVSDKLVEIEQLFSVDIGLIDNNSGAKHISECMPEYIDRLDKRWNNPDDVLFTTGIPELDTVFDGGLEVGLHAFAARPKMGKTELMVKMVNHNAMERGLPVYVGSLEMPDFQVIERLVSSFGRINKTEIKNNFKDMHDHDLAMGAFVQSCGEVGKSDIYIHDDSFNTPSKIRKECLKIKKKHGIIGPVFVDYLGLLDADGKHFNKTLEIASITKALKSLSKELDVPVVMLLQLNRELEKRPDKRPIPSDSRDSGAIEQDVDSWTGIYRDSVYHDDSPWKNITEVIVRLNRHGGVGVAYQALTGSGFSNVSEEDVSRLVHMEESNKNTNYGTDGF